MKSKHAYVSLALTLGIFGVAAVYAQQQVAKPSAASGVSVNGVAIPQARIDFAVKQVASQGRPNTPELAEAVRNQLIDQELLAQQNILGRAYLQDFLKSNPIGDDALKSEYEKFRKELGDKEYKPRHILVEKEDDAKGIIDQLGKGGDFAKIAQEKSKDTGSKDNGGDLDWGPAGRFVPPFAEALKKLGKGQVTQAPVQTNFGFHVIKMDDVRDMQVPAFDEVKEQFRQRVQQDQFVAMVADLRKNAKIVEQK